MRLDPELVWLEADVIARIAEQRRAARRGGGVFGVAVLACLISLLGGLCTGMAGSWNSARAPGSEAIVVEDLSLAPSSLLASNL